MKSQVNRILTKLNLRDRAQAIVLAYESGLIEPGSSTPTAVSPQAPELMSKMPPRPMGGARSSPAVHT